MQVSFTPFLLCSFPLLQSLNQYVLLEGLDILGDLVHRYGVLLTSYHQQLQESLIPLLMDPRPVSVRKRAYMALCELGACTMSGRGPVFFMDT